MEANDCVVEVKEEQGEEKTQLTAWLIFKCCCCCCINSIITPVVSQFIPVFIYGDVFRRPTGVRVDLFSGSVQEMELQLTKTSGPSDTLKSISPKTCTHLSVVSWQLDVCDNCQSNLGPVRLAKERALADITAKKDALVDNQTEKLHARGVNVDWLLAFTFDHDCWAWPTWKVVKDIIKPATMSTRCRYADLEEMKVYVGPATIFMSHCWGAAWGDLVANAVVGARSDRIVWIDIFAVRQWPGNCADLDFRGVIQRRKAVVVSVSSCESLFPWISNDTDREIWIKSKMGMEAQKVIPFFRLWCIVEIAAAVTMNINVIVRGGMAKHISLKEFKHNSSGVEEMLHNLAYLVSCVKSRSTVQADYDREMKYIKALHGGVIKIDKMMVKVIDAGQSTARYNLMAVDAYACGEKDLLMEMEPTLKINRKTAENVLAATATGNRTELLKELLSEYSVTHNLLVDTSFALWWAAGTGNVESVRILIEQDGIDVNQTNTSYKEPKRTPLFNACKHGFVEVVEALLSHPNIDPNRVTVDGRTSIWVAVHAIVSGEADRNKASIQIYLKVVRLLLEVEGIIVDLRFCQQTAREMAAKCQWLPELGTMFEMVKETKETV